MMRPGQPLRYDSEYERLGTCNIFMFVEPLRGYRHVRVLSPCFTSLVSSMKPTVLDGYSFAKLADLRNINPAR